MKLFLRFLLFVFAFQFISFTGFSSKKPVKVLIFSKTLGYRHKSIEVGIAAIQKLGKENGFIADTTEDTRKFNLKNLKQYKCLIFLSPTGDNFFNEQQKAAFQKFIRKGGGFVGIHAATDCLFSWDWYGQLIGAYFANHPEIQQASLAITETNHPATARIASPWFHTDEWYNFKFVNPDIKTLINLDEKSYKGGKNGSYHPISWCHEFERGRVFYTGLGHTKEAYQDEIFLSHLLGGIKYSLRMQY